jgi:translin
MLEQMRRYFDGQEKLREQALNLSRHVVRASARAIAAMHRDDQAVAIKMLEEARTGLVELKKVVKGDPLWVKSGITQSAQQEYCEAKLLEGLFRQGKLSTPEELKIPYQPYLAAMADVSGELRRRALDLIRSDEVTEAERLLKTMEEIHEFLMSFDYPDAVLPGMKRRQDMVRGVLEKTRGDLTTALRQQRLERALERAKRKGAK